MIGFGGDLVGGCGEIRVALGVKRFQALGARILAARSVVILGLEDVVKRGPRYIDLLSLLS